MKTNFGFNPKAMMGAACKKPILGLVALMLLGLTIVLILWQNTNLLCQPDAEDQWLTPLKFW